MSIQNLWRKRESIIVTWLVSYSVVLFVPIAISLVIYAQSSQALKSEIHRANDSLLKQMRYTIDSQIDLMKRLNMEMTWSPNLQQVMYSGMPAQEVPYSAYQLVNEFRLYKTSYASIDEFYVISSRDGSVYRSGNIRDLNTAFYTIHRTGALTFEEWKDTVLKAPNNSFVVLPHSTAAEAKTSIAYITQLPKDMYGQSAGSVVVMSDTRRFQEAVAGIADFNGSTLLILNADNEILMSNQPGSKELTPFINGKRFQFDPAQSSGLELFSIDSSVSDLRYALIIPSSIYWEKAEYVRNFTYVSILVSLIGAGVLTWFFMRRNYSPIQQLIESLQDKNTDRTYADVNEFQFIQKVVARTRTENDEITQQLKKHEQVLRSNMINRLLKGKPDTLVPYEDAFRSFQMKYLSSEFAVLLFGIENEEKLYEFLPGIDLNERSKLIQLIISNVVEELVERQGHAGYVAEADDMMVCLVNLKADSPAWEQDLHHIAAEAQQFLERYDMEITVSISGRHSSWIGISEAYREAVDAMEYKMVLGKKGIIAYKDIRPGSSADIGYGYYYPLQVEQQLINFIKAGDLEQASSYMNEVIEKNLDKPVMPLTMARCLMFNLIGTMIKAINELGDGNDSTLADNPRWINGLMACDTIREMQQKLQALLQEVCGFASAKRLTHLSREREDSLRSLMDQVQQYIQDHYMDMNLNVNAIGEHFQLKGSYLSKLFKNHTGEGMLDYLHKYRIEQAKELMRTRQESVSETSRQVGYNDPATFIRVFKKYEGITPGKYKEIV
ncbi:AraC family transcriptional regulator [Paenibacillus yonginensis]|uniref:AraC family transcriptional regulator n=1 Tax=Paenibacillus yonginensis TaxID=1462996 RepID=A0A1B1N1V5_9BACL|nr:helix-turn-helix domain-containing protein [Paenibacillus yonginensis]ANS75395.1 AraC family transcriptional regulator [Paenibacillus yonginensis]